MTHCRYGPVGHKFWYRLYMVYLDLEESRTAPQLRKLLSTRRFAAAAFLASDHLKGRPGCMEEAVRDLVQERTGTRPSGPIRVLTQLRQFGCYFSPLNLFFCFGGEGERIEAIVGEVNNTPWREQHHYVLSSHNGSQSGSVWRYSHAKDFHVSPFMDMDYQYHWEITVPDEQLRVRLENRRGDARTFDASLMLARQPMTGWHLTKMTLRYPLMSAQIMAAIYYQAFRLWWKKCPAYSHPAKRKDYHPAGS